MPDRSNPLTNKDIPFLALGGQFRDLVWPVVSTLPPYIRDRRDMLIRSNPLTNKDFTIWRWGAVYGPGFDAGRVPWTGYEPPPHRPYFETLMGMIGRRE